MITATYKHDTVFPSIDCKLVSVRDDALYFEAVKHNNYGAILTFSVSFKEIASTYYPSVLFLEKLREADAKL